MCSMWVVRKKKWEKEREKKNEIKTEKNNKQKLAYDSTNAWVYYICVAHSWKERKIEWEGKILYTRKKHMSFYVISSRLEYRRKK